MPNNYQTKALLPTPLLTLGTKGYHTILKKTKGTNTDSPDSPGSQSREDWIAMIIPYGGDEEIMGEEREQYQCSKPDYLIGLPDTIWL